MTLLQTLDDLKYLERLNLMDFADLLFPDSENTYLMGKWDLFRHNPLHFLWSLDSERVETVSHYINGCKEDSQ
jgi:hypothetical protein